jgi:hypothetical protein
MVIAFRPEGQTTSSDPARIVWKYTRGTADVASPIPYGEKHLFAIT